MRVVPKKRNYKKTLHFNKEEIGFYQPVQPDKIIIILIRNINNSNKIKKIKRKINSLLLNLLSK